MTLARRLTAVEDALSPTELVLRWLAEAHAYDRFEAYLDSVLDGDPTEFPMDRLAREAKEWATRVNRGKPRDEIDKAVRGAMVAACFRVLLVLRINTLATEFRDRELLVRGLLSAHVCLALELAAQSKPERIGSVAMFRDLLLGRVTEFHALEEARRRVEARYLDGASALFPAEMTAWDADCAESKQMAAMTVRFAELDGFGLPPEDDVEAFEAKVARRVADHVEEARAKAYFELGEGRRGLAHMRSWLRPTPAA